MANTLKLFRQGAVGFIDWLPQPPSASAADCSAVISESRALGSDSTASRTSVNPARLKNGAPRFQDPLNSGRGAQNV